MKKTFLPLHALLCVLVLATFSFSCALTKSLALNAVSDSLAGSDKNGKVHAAQKRHAQTKASSPAAKTNENDALSAVLTGEKDPVLMGDFFPTALKLYEIILAQNPKHRGLAVTTGSLYVMYANAFVQAPAEMLPSSQYSHQAEEQQRAKLHYLRGRNYALRSLELRCAGIESALLSGNTELCAPFFTRLKKDDAAAAYWAGAGWLGAFSADPLDVEQLKTLPCAVALLEKAAELDGSYNNGAVWDALTSFYAQVPPEFGGDLERARFASEQSFLVSQGKTPGPYITYATSFCVADQDALGFKENLQKALAINLDADPANRLGVVIAQKKAAWLLAHGDDYFIEWE